MPEVKFVTIASFETATAAWIHRNYLVQNGLSAFVIDEHTVNADWLYSNAVGGVKVQIPASELVAFQKVPKPIPLRFAQPKPTDSNSQSCPKCNSDEISIINWPKRLIFLTWLIIGFPIPIYAPRLVCNGCKYRQSFKFDIPKQFRIIHLTILTTVVALVLGFCVHLEIDWPNFISSHTVPP